jgi:hypothetical protein
MGAKFGRKQNPKSRRRRSGRRAQLRVAAAGVAAGGLLAGFLSAAGPGGPVTVTSGGPARCVIIKVVP